MHRVVLRTCAIPRFNLSQLRTNSTNAAVKPRLVVEFDGLVIPSQRDVLPLENTAADSSSPRALHTDHDSAVASLVWEAGNEQPPHDPTIEQRRKARLAREAGSEQARQDATIEQRRKARLAREAANNQLLQDPTIEQRREARLAREAANKQPRQDPTIEQRRDARLAPEAANKQPRQDPTIEQRRDSRKTSPRQDPTIEQRREARLAREAANKQDHTIEQRREAHLALESSRHRQDPTITQRREERWDLEALMDTDNRRPSSKSDLRPHSSTGEKMPGIWDMDLFPAMAVDHGQSEGLDALGKFKARVNTADAKFRNSGDRNSGRGRPAFNASRTMTGVEPRSLDSQRTEVKKPRSIAQSPDANDGTDGDPEDINFSMIERGGEYAYGPEISAPEGLSVDLTDVFRPKQATLELVPTPALRSADSSAPALTKNQTQEILETLGGDYARYSPQSALIYLNRGAKKDAVKQALLVLSKNKAVDLNQRENLLGIVKTLKTGRESLT